MSSAAFILNPNKPSTFQDEPITSVTKYNVNPEHQTASNSTDGYGTVTAVHTDGRSYSITIDTTDAEFASNPKFQDGESGELVLYCISRGKGKAQGTTKKSRTFRDVICHGATENLPTQGISEYTISFTAYASDGEDPCVWGNY